MAPLQFALDITPQTRVSLTDVRSHAAATVGDNLDRYAHCFYSSLHTTAGYLPQSLQRRLVGQQQGVTSYLDLYRALFPERGGYRHDDLGDRSELTAEQRRREPLNGDSHLRFIFGGLRACVSYRLQPAPVYFVDLDGIFENTPRKRTTVLVGYDEEVTVAHTDLKIPVSSHPIEAVSLKDPRYGLHEQLTDFVSRHDSGKGRLRLELATGEKHACLTVNEYETLLMRHDLADVLREPFRFVAEKARHVWNEPRSVPLKARAYARYDVVQAVNQLVDVLGLPTSRIEQLVARALAKPAERLFGVKRSIDLLVSNVNPSGQTAVVEGTYQSPILIHWRNAERNTYTVRATLSRFV
mgnify:FL=1|tara:strand:- start:12162 stop:13223 length:1062 start_codon:yes stop_codon:yes gene_type:complete